MPRKARHPERELLEFVHGSISQKGREAVEAHLRECNKCSTLVAVVAALKNQAQAGGSVDVVDRQAEGHSTTAYGPRLTSPPPEVGSAQGQEHRVPTVRRDLEFKDLVQDQNVDRPMLTQQPGTWHEESVQDHVSSAHLDSGELASYFYGELPEAVRAAAAGHLAICSECSSAMSIYSESEATLRKGSAAAAAADSGMSGDNWRLIKEWEETCLAEPRPETETPSRAMLERFIEILRDHKDEIDRVGNLLDDQIALHKPQIVPVIILDSKGEFRGVEPFHRLTRPQGLEALESLAPARRFNNLPLHALVGAERHYPMVVSGRINRGTAELDFGSVQAGLIPRLGYFIVEN